MEREPSIDYDKIVRDEQNRLRSEDVQDFNEMHSCGCPSCSQAAESLRYKLNREQWYKEHPPGWDHEIDWEIEQAWRLFEENNT